jgi:outer membrane biosynthesis protein TonB
MLKTNQFHAHGPLLATLATSSSVQAHRVPAHSSYFNGVVSVRISIVLLTASGLLMGCGSKNTTSTTPSPRTGTVVVVSDKKPAKPVTKKPAPVTEKKAAKAEKKAEKADAKAEKKAEKASEKSEKASQKSENKAEKAAEKSSDKPEPKPEKASGKPDHAASSAPRHVHVPPGHYPPEGMCRLWYEGRAPGQQPKPTDCSKLKGKIPADAFVLYNGKYFDGGYDWSRAKRSSIPEKLIDILIASR